MPFSFAQCAIPDIVLIQPKIFCDQRGSFIELYKKSEFEVTIIPGNFSQDNFSVSAKNVLRGLHYQKQPKAQGKIVTVLKGRAFDVAVDIRRGSPTFLKWVSVELNDKNRLMLYIPPGFAHGFFALTEEVHLFYKCSNEYDPGLDAGIRWNDPDVGVRWPAENPVVSEKDAILPYAKDAEIF
jgi:dTDP-4-dehydrorhamnose 3,5-epimerase